MNRGAIDILLPKGVITIIDMFVHKVCIDSVNTQILQLVEPTEQLITDSVVLNSYHWGYTYIRPNLLLVSNKKAKGYYWRLARPFTFDTIGLLHLSLVSNFFTFINGCLHVVTMTSRSNASIKIWPVFLWNPSMNRIQFIQELPSMGLSKVLTLTYSLGINENSSIDTWSYEIEDPYLNNSNLITF